MLANQCCAYDTVVLAVQGPGSKGKKEQKTGGIAIQQPYLRVLGIDEDAEGGRDLTAFTYASLSGIYGSWHAMCLLCMLHHACVGSGMRQYTPCKQPKGSISLQRESSNACELLAGS